MGVYSAMRAQVKEALDSKRDDSKREIFVACQNKTYALMESQSFPNFTNSKHFHRAILALVTISMSPHSRNKVNLFPLCVCLDNNNSR
jgi:hypothetical protein